MLYTWNVKTSFKQLLSKDLNDNRVTVYNLAVNSPRVFLVSNIRGESYKHTVPNADNGESLRLQ